MSKQLDLFGFDNVSQVPFVDEVEIFNRTFGKPNNYEPTIPEYKEWKFVYDFILEELEEYREACERGDIVEASNMSKACETEEEAMETIAVRSKEQNEDCHWEKVDDMYIVYRTRDRKVMKSLNYFKPNLTKFFTDEELSKFN
mgnify:CR=1 FL=1